jgi:phospholipid/cholesterol/gamma-HCH transport system substrate-binding protein
MRVTHKQEIIVGIFVSLGLLALLVLALKVSNLSLVSSSSDSYQLTAYFENVGGLRVKAPVSVSGVKIGQVTSVAYDAKRFQAKVDMQINDEHRFLSTDTQASIYTAGLLGEQYITLAPGAEDEVLKDGDIIVHTQSALVLEELIGQFMVNMTTQDK